MKALLEGVRRRLAAEGFSCSNDEMVTLPFKYASISYPREVREQMKVQAVTERQVTQMVNLPNKLYQDDSCWVAEGPLDREVTLKVRYTEKPSVLSQLSATIVGVETSEHKSERGAAHAA